MFKASKGLYTWDFTLDNAKHKVELIHSRLTGKRVISVDGKEVSTCLKYTYNYTYSFPLEGHYMTLLQISPDQYDLRIDNISFMLLKNKSRYKKKETEKKKRKDDSDSDDDKKSKKKKAKEDNNFFDDAGGFDFGGNDNNMGNIANDFDFGDDDNNNKNKEKKNKNSNNTNQNQQNINNKSKIGRASCRERV